MVACQRPVTKLRACMLARQRLEALAALDAEREAAEAERAAELAAAEAEQQRVAAEKAAMEARLEAQAKEAAAREAERAAAAEARLLETLHLVRADGNMHPGEGFGGLTMSRSPRLWHCVLLQARRHVAALRIGRAWRRYLAGPTRAARLAAVVRIQAAWRGCRDRRRVVQLRKQRDVMRALEVRGKVLLRHHSASHV